MTQPFYSLEYAQRTEHSTRNNTAQPCLPLLNTQELGNENNLNILQLTNWCDMYALWNPI